MFSAWFLHTVAFTLLVRVDAGDNQCTDSEVKPEKDSPLNSLQCYNDYKAHVQCTWEVDSRVHSQDNLPLTELYWRDKSKEAPCVYINKTSVLLSNGKILHTCSYNTKRFGLGVDHILYFKTPCRSTTLQASQHVKVMAPIDLAEMVADGGGHLLSWKSPYPASSKITRTLVYQLQYRKFMDDWTTVDNISLSEHMIDKESLLPGNQYQARVRARGPVGLWSDWSPLLSWKTLKDAEPFNLQCVIVGDTTVTCSWQMKTEYFQLMSYNILCKDSDTESYPCCETPQLQSTDDGLSEFVCSVNTTDPFHLTVEFKQMQNIRTFKTPHNVKLPQPDQIKVKNDDGIFNLSWSEPIVSKRIYFSTELKISTNESSDIIQQLSDTLDLAIPAEILRPSSVYQAQIRFIHIPDEIFVVQSSEWSEPVVFTTDPAVTSTGIEFAILAVVFATVFIIILYNALPVCHRRIMLWKGSVPSPIKSEVLKEMIKKYPTGWPYLQSENEATSICVLLATDNISIKNSISWEPSLHNEDAVKMGLSEGLNHSCTFVEKGMSEDKSGMNFSGPYILCSEDSCIQDKAFEGSTDKNDTSVTGKSESSAPVNGYVVTPPTAVPATPNPAPVDNPTNDPSDEPPAYTPSPDQTCTVVPHPSGYFTMPFVATVQPQPREYVTLSHNPT